MSASQLVLLLNSGAAPVRLRRGGFPMLTFSAVDAY